MSLIYDQLPPDAALHAQQLSRLIYETRENRRKVLDASGATDEDQLLHRIVHAELAEHPGYELYLAARILGDTHQAARTAIAALMQEANR